MSEKMRPKYEEPTIKGLKCDNPACSWRDEGITFEEYAHWLNRPCPLCGQNVLTDADYDTAQFLMKICRHPVIRFLNRLAACFPKKHYRTDLGMDGTGKVKFTKISEEKV